MLKPVVTSEPINATGDERRSSRQAGSKRLGAVLGVWISLYPFADLLFRPKTALQGVLGGAVGISPLVLGAYLVILAAGVAPILAGALTLGVDFRRAKFLAAALMVFCLSIPLSLFSSNDIGSLQYLLLTYYVFACALLLVATKTDGAVLLHAFFTTAALTLAVAMTVALIDHDVAWGRFFGHMAPNYWGGLALGCIIATLGMRGWRLRLPLIALGLFMIGSSQSRGEMMALAATLSLLLILYTRRRQAGRVLWAWLLIAFGIVVAVGLGSDYISNDILKLSDTARGLNSGFTGRVEGWREGRDLFTSHPWLGVGYQRHDHYMTPGTAIHDGYLSTLADTGVIGFIGYMIFAIGGLCRALVTAWTRPTGVNFTVACFLFAFSLVAFVEPSGVHTGDTVAMMMTFLTAWAWRTEARDINIGADSR